MPEIVARVNPFAGRYIEPFAGSATVFFALEPRSAILSDLNGELISAYKQIKSSPDFVYHNYSELTNDKVTYYKIRERMKTEECELTRAAYFIYLNRFCFNGLYRTNLKGEFNVPYAGERTGALPPVSSLREVSTLLQRVQLFAGDFEDVTRNVVSAGDFVYLDPPYFTRSTRIFRQYGEELFSEQDLDRLEELLEHIDSVGAQFLLSYALCPEIMDRFRRWHVEEVMTLRNVSGFAKHRRSAVEVLVSNRDQ